MKYRASAVWVFTGASSRRVVTHTRALVIMNVNKLELFQNEISCKCMSGGQGHRYQYGIVGKTRSRKQLSWRHGIPIGGCSLPRIVSAVHGAVDAGPKDLPPSYDAIDSQPLNRLVYSLFRKKMVSALNEQDSPLEGYDAIIDLTRRLNALGSPGETQKKTRYILNSLFPSWLPGAFKIMFAKPMPEISCKLNAWATWLTCQWLMGPCTVNDTEIDGGEIGKGHGVLVERCRYISYFFFVFVYLLKKMKFIAACSYLSLHGALSV